MRIILIVCFLFAPLFADGFCSNTTQRLEQEQIKLQAELNRLTLQISLIQRTKLLVDRLRVFPSACNDYDVYQSARLLLKECDNAIAGYQPYVNQNPAIINGPIPFERTQSCEYATHILLYVQALTKQVIEYTWPNAQVEANATYGYELAQYQAPYRFDQYQTIRSLSLKHLERAEAYAKSQVEHCNSQLADFINGNANDGNRRRFADAEKLIASFQNIPVYDLECYKTINGNILSCTQNIISLAWEACPQDIERDYQRYVIAPEKCNQKELVEFCTNVIKRARKERHGFRCLENQVNRVTENFGCRPQEFEKAIELLNECYEISQTDTLTKRGKAVKLMILLMSNVQLACYSQNSHHIIQEKTAIYNRQYDARQIDHNGIYKITYAEINRLKALFSEYYK